MNRDILNILHLSTIIIPLSGFPQKPGPRVYSSTFIVNFYLNKSDLTTLFIHLNWKKKIRTHFLNKFGSSSNVTLRPVDSPFRELKLCRKFDLPICKIWLYTCLFCNQEQFHKLKLALIFSIWAIVLVMFVLSAIFYY